MALPAEQREERVESAYERQRRLQAEWEKLAEPLIETPKSIGDEAAAMLADEEAQTGLIRKRARKEVLADSVVVGKAKWLKNLAEIDPRPERALTRRTEAIALLKQAIDKRYQRLFDEEVQRRSVRAVERARGAIPLRAEVAEDVLQAGVYADPSAVLPTPEQQEAISAQRLYKPTPEQAEAAAYERAPREALRSLLLGEEAPFAEITRQEQAREMLGGPAGGGLSEKLMIPARMTGGAIAGAARELQEVPSKAGIASTALGYLGAAIPTRVPSLTELALLGYAGPAGVAMAPFTLFDPTKIGPKRAEIAGINIPAAAQAVVEDPSLLARAGQRAGRQAVAYGLEGETGAGMGGLFAAAARKNLKRAVSELRERGVEGMSREQILEAVRVRATELNATDLASAGIENPLAAQDLTELVLDPLNVPGVITKPLGLAAKAARMVPGVEKGLAAVKASKAIRAFSPSGPYWDLPESMQQELMTLVPGAGEAVSVQRGMLAEEIERAARPSRLEQAKRLLTGKRPGFTEAERAQVSQYLNAPGSAVEEAGLTKPIQEAVQRFRGVEETSTALRRATPGAHQLIDPETGRVLPMAEREIYGHPQVPLERKPEWPFETVGGPEQRMKALPSTARPRTAEESIMDPVATWRKVAPELRRKEAVAAQVVEIHKTLAEHGAVVYAARGSQAKRLAGKINEVGHSLGGVKMANLSTHAGDAGRSLAEEYLRITMKPGTRVKQLDVYMPEPIADRILELFPRHEAGPTGAAILAKAASEWVIKPAMRIWMTGTTVMTPAFHMVNMVGAPELGAVALGLRAANPGLQASAVVGALSEAYSGGKLARNMKIALRGGETIALGEALDLARRAGVTRMARELYVGTGKAGHKYSPFTWAAKGAERISRGVGPLSPEKLAQFTDDYQHLVAFLGVLRGTDRKSVAAAADFAAKTTGNYRRLSEVDKAVKDFFGFYSWNRFILPYLAKTLITHPGRLAFWEKVRQAQDHRYTARTPKAAIAARGMPKWLLSRGAFPAPADLQPQAIWEAGENDLTLAVMETPLTTLSNLLGDGGKAAGNNLSIGLKGTIELLTGRDLFTGKVIPDTWAMLKEVGLQPIERPSRWAMDLYKLYVEEGEYEAAASLALRLRVGNDMQGFDRLFLKATNALGFTRIPEGAMSKGQWGLKAYLISPEAETMRKTEEALQTGQARLKYHESR